MTSPQEQVGWRKGSPSGAATQQTLCRSQRTHAGGTPQHPVEPGCLRSCGHRGAVTRVFLGLRRSHERKLGVIARLLLLIQHVPLRREQLLDLLGRGVRVLSNHLRAQERVGRTTGTSWGCIPDSPGESGLVSTTCRLSLVAATGAPLHCSARTSQCRGFSYCRTQALAAWASVEVALGL